MNKCLFLYFVLAGYCGAFAQLPGYAWPIDAPQTVTGNYGELRPNHFHAGIDFSTGGTIGRPIYAVADAYVSRVKVSSGAYGRAVYLSHSGDNRLSLYAHLSAFAGALAGFVEQEQYAARSYELERFPAPGLLRVRKGELIGFSGNSGHSSGPHLHFELRDQQTEVPLDPLQFFAIGDSVKPEIQALAFYDLSDTLSPVFLRHVAVKRQKSDTAFLADDTLAFSASVLGVAFAGLDRMMAKGNPNVIHAARLVCDAQTIFSYRLQNIAFDEQRYVNEFTELRHKLKFQKCFLPTLYPPIYPDHINKGRIQPADTGYHTLRLEVEDERSNMRLLQLVIRTTMPGGFRTPASFNRLLDCTRAHTLVAQGVSMVLPEGSCYSSYAPWVDNKLEQAGALYIHPSQLNLRNPYVLSFAVPNRWRTYTGRLVLENNGAFYTAEQAGDTLSFRPRNFGSCHLMVDTVSPIIRTQLSPKQIRRLSVIKSFNFVVRDLMSGVARCDLYVNGQWTLAEYDAKTNLLIYSPVDGVQRPTEFRIEAVDRVGNRREFVYTLKRKSN